MWSGPGRTCSDDKSMCQDATVTSREECLRQNCARSEEHSSGADAAAPNQPHSMPAQSASAAREPPQPLHRALSRAQHFAQTPGTFATDACPLPQRVSDALPGRAACSLHTLVTFGSQTSAHHAVRARARSAALLRALFPANSAAMRSRAAVQVSSGSKQPRMVRARALLRPHHRPPVSR